MNKAISLVNQPERPEPERRCGGAEEQRKKDKFAATSSVDARQASAKTSTPDAACMAQQLAASPAAREVDGAGDQISIWQETLWREWRNTSDEEYAEHLFELVGDEPAGYEAAIISTALGVFYGGLTGLLAAFIGAMGESSQMWGVSAWPILAGLGAAVGGTGSLLARLTWQRQLSWRDWLARLTFYMAPNELGLGGAALVLALLGSLVGWLLGWSTGLGHVIGLMALSILLAASLGTKLVGWLIGLKREPNPKHIHRYRGLWFWWRKRPPGVEVEAALRRACDVSPAAQKIWAGVLKNLMRRKKAPDSLDKLVAHLQSRDWVERFTAAHLLAASGGEAVAALHPIAARKTSPLRRTAIRLLQGIEQETTARLADRANRLLCPHCLARCGPHSASVSDDTTITYYGCRICKQSGEFLVGEVMAVLETGVSDEPLRQRKGGVRINWLARRALFDFDSVEIIQATDEEVERFAVQVGNDTDPFRRPRYKQMRCFVDPACGLSENTLRILESIFGEIKQI